MSNDSIKVVCRLRPLNKIQIANKGQQCVTFSNKDITITVGGQDNKYNFAFDKVFGPTTHQQQIYKEVAIPVINSVIGGFNGTIFAYGQTGGGKTWTMQGPNHHDAQFRGLIPRTIQGLFQTIGESDPNLQFVIKCSYIQIYNEKLFDLLDPSKSRLQIKEDKHKGVFIQNCTEISVGSGQQMLKTMDSGAQNRRVAFTGMNQRSSRSHSLFIIYVNQKNLKKDCSKQSKLYFVDLAGSQKVGKTGVQGQQLEQAKNINKSLSSLGNVINALTSQKKQHVPYRDSKLTRILQQSLGGNSKTTLIINCSMCTYNDKQTLSTLRFGYRAKSIKNKPKVNEQKSVKELMLLLQSANKTIAQLKGQLSRGEYIKTNEDVIDKQQGQLINELKNKVQQLKRQQQDKQKQLIDMELRIKSLMLQLGQNKQIHNKHMQECSKVNQTIKNQLIKINKYMGRVYIDLQYWINNMILQGSSQNQQIRANLSKTFSSIVQFTAFYQNQLKPIFTPSQEIQQQQSPCRTRQLSQRKIKITYSEPNLNQNLNNSNQELQMSCIVTRKQQQEENTITNSDKLSQQQSFTEIETLLQSLQTKQSQRMAIQELSYKIKCLTKQNQQLSLKNQKLLIQQKVYAQKIQQKFQDKIMDLQQRVQQYRNIIKQKDIELTSYIATIQKQKGVHANQKIIIQNLKKVIDGNANLKVYHQMQQKLKSLASERQRIFNQLFKLRNQLDEAQITIKQKQDHILSLKEVMKELSSPQLQTLNQKQIQKRYNKEIYGTQTPNIVVTVKGGTKPDSNKKQSSLRRKVNNLIDKRQAEGKANILPFIKGFFN